MAICRPMRTLIFALLTVLGLSPAYAQQVGAPFFPQTLPPNTVVGNASGVTGPANAIAFSALFSGQTVTNPIFVNPVQSGLLFAALPASPLAGTVAYITDGLAANCGDSACTTFGTNITGGTGTLKLLAWYNGAHWTLMGK